MVIECTVTSCKVKLETQTQKTAEDAGWKGINESQAPPAGHKDRTHLGWCASCAKYYNVTD